MLIPHVVEKTGRSEKPIDLPSRLLQDRIVYLGTEINAEVANIIIMQLLWLQADDPDKDINLYISSPGGCVYSGLGIKDIIDNLSCKVNTVGVGMVASMGAYLLSAGTGVRKATKNCRIMIHSVSSGSQGTIHDMEVDFHESKYLNNKLMIDIANYSKGKSTVQTIKKKTERDYYIDPDEAIQMGLIDKKI